MSNDKPEATENQGEGNKEADRRYRSEAQKFAESDKVEQAAAEAANMSEQEKAESEKAAEQAKDRARK